MAYFKKHRDTSPCWISARFASACGDCGGKVSRADTVLYIPVGKKVLCQLCAHDIWQGMLAERSVEKYGTDCAYDC